MRILRAGSMPYKLTILQRKNVSDDAREVSDLSAKIMAAMAGRHATTAATRVNCA